MLQSSYLQHSYTITGTEGGSGSGVAYMRATSDKTQEPAQLLLRKVGDSFDLDSLLLACRDLFDFEHPQIASLLDLGMVDQETVFFVYRPLLGITLTQISAAQAGGMPEDRALTLIHDAMRALDSLRREGLNHNNISLRNIVITQDKRLALNMPLPRVIDDVSSPNLFISDDELDYYAPERLLSQGRTDLVSDQFAMGACLFRCVLGRPLLSAAERTEKIDQQQTGAFNRDDPDVVQLSENFAKVLRCALNPDREHRYQLPNDFRHDMNMLIGKEDPDRAHKILSFGDKESADVVAQDGSQAMDAGSIQRRLESLQEKKKEHQAPPVKKISAAALKNISMTMRKLITIGKDGMEAKIRLAPGVVFPEELLRAILQAEGIRHGIQEGGILRAATARPMIRKVTLAAGTPPGPGRVGYTVNGEEIPALPELILIQLEQEGMRAVAQVVTDQAIPAEVIASKMSALAISNGIDQALLEKLSTTGSSAPEIILAQGLEPTEGKPAAFRLIKGDLDPDAPMVVVRRGERFAEWHRPEGGREGYTVTGRSLAFDMPEGIPKEMMAGPGTRIEVKNNTTYLVAERDGAVEKSESGILQVREVLVIRGGMLLGRSPDPLETDAFVLVEGDIRDGCTLHTSGDCVVEGNIADADVVVGGNLTVRGDIQPGEQEIKVGGQLRVSNIVQRQLTAGEVRAHEQIRQSVVVSTKGVHAKVAIGGTLTAADSFVIDEIGDVAGTQTAIWAGYHVPKAIQHEMAVMSERRTRHDRELMIQEREVFGQLIEQLAHKDYMQHVLGYMRQDYKKSMLNRFRQLKIRMEQLGEEMVENRLEILDSRERVNEVADSVADHDAEVTIEGTIHEGVTIKIGETSTRRIEKKQDQAIFKL